MPPRYRAIHPVFHASKLTTYSESTIYGQKPVPPIINSNQRLERIGGRKDFATLSEI